MAQRKNNNVENEEQVEVREPETWEELVRENDVLQGLPDMKRVQDFTPADKARFGSLMARVDEVIERSGSMNVEENPVQAIDSIGEVVEYCDGLFRAFAADKEAYQSWTLPLGLDELFGAFMQMRRFYMVQMGKLIASKKRSTSAE